jgi:hypothetical protein
MNNTFNGGAMSDQVINQQWRIIGPSSTQWSDIKDIFTQLYIVENRKLKDVREILSKRHGFNARYVLSTSLMES